MSFITVGTNHKFSHLSLREKLTFSKRRLKDALFLLKEIDVFKAAVIISTCNRVEIYADVEDSERGVREIIDFISRYHEIDKQKLLPQLYIYEGKEAIRHLFTVACGLDSLILGETQILSQARSAFLEAQKADFTNNNLGEIFNSAISFAKRIHVETKISEGKVSVGSVAIDFIKERVGSLADKNILIIGVGKVTDLVLQYLKKEQSNVVFISNRTFEKAKELADGIKAKAVRFDEIQEYLKKADIVITATASPHFVIKKETLEKAINHKLLIIDLALPRDVDPRVKEIENVDLFCLEDLDTVIKNNIERKTQEAEKVGTIIKTEVEKIWAKPTELEQEPVLLP